MIFGITQARLAPTVAARLLPLSRDASFVETGFVTLGLPFEIIDSDTPVSQLVWLARILPELRKAESS